MTAPDGYPDAWIGVDPGAVRTGVVARHGDDIVYAATVQAPKVSPGWSVGKGKGMAVGEDYAHAIRAAVEAAWTAWIRHGMDLEAALPGLAIEQLNAPSGRVGGAVASLQPGYMMAATYSLAIAQGCYLADPDRWTAHVMVPAGANGRRTLGDYPGQLITPGEARHGLDRRAPDGSLQSHQRSAWDVAGLAPQALTARDTGGTIPALSRAQKRKNGAALW